MGKDKSKEPRCKKQNELQNENIDLKVKIIFMASEIAKLKKIINNFENPYI
jgi:hypothetical protein